MTATRDEIAKLYVATFDRAADADGLAYWISDGTSATTSLTDIEDLASAMTDSAEYKALYDGMDREHIVTAMYNNLFDRAPDASGLTYWVSGDGATVPVDELIIALINGAKDDDAGQDKTIMDNKATVGLAYADAGLNDVAEAKTILSGVTADPATVTAAEAEVNNLVPQTFDLTTGADALVGGKADDTINAVNSSLASEGTLQDTDSIDGGAGNDTINISMKQGWSGFGTGSMKNVENVNLTNDSTAALTYSAKGSTDVTKYTVVNTAGNTTLSDLTDLASLDVTAPANTSTLTATYGAATTVATGTQTDTQELKVTNVGTIDTSSTATSNAKALTVNIAKVEALNLTTAGTSNTLNLSGVSDAKTITVSGDGQTEIQAVDAAMTSFDASAATGNVIATLTNAATNKLTTVKSGAGDDKVTVDASDLTASATVEGGAGADTLTLNGTGKTLQNTMSGFETLALNGVTGTLTFSGTNVSDIATLNVTNLGAASTNSLVNMGANALVVNATGNNAGTLLRRGD